MNLQSGGVNLYGTQDRIASGISSGGYAVFTCTLPTIGATYEHIYGTWLPASGYRHADGPEFELYRDEEFDPEDPDSVMHIYIPIEK